MQELKYLTFKKWNEIACNSQTNLSDDSLNLKIKNE